MLGRQATFARAARPPRSARRSVQFSAVARRRRMFPRQPPASAPASCTREPMTVFKALADRHRVKILNRLLAANAKPSASATSRRCSTSSSRRSATTSRSCSTPASSRASSAARSPTSRSIPPPSSGSATSSRCLFARSPPDAASRVTREPIPRIRPAVGEDVAAITAACVVRTGGATGRAAAAIGHRSAPQCPNPREKTAIRGHRRSGGRSSEPG